VAMLVVDREVRGGGIGTFLSHCLFQAMFSKYGAQLEVSCSTILYFSQTSQPIRMYINRSNKTKIGSDVGHGNIEK